MTALREASLRLGAYFRLILSSDPDIGDVCLLILGTITAIASGVPFPLLGILFGQLMDDINSASCDNASPSSAGATYQSDVNTRVLTVVYIGIANIVLIYVYIVSWNLFGERLAQRLRERYLRGLVHKDVAFFDELSPGQVSSHLNTDIVTIQQGISEKVGIVLNACSFFVTAYVIAFIKAPKLGGMLVSLTPAFMLMALIGGHYVGKYSGAMSNKISIASSVALEALSSVIVVHAFGANPKLEKSFSEIMSNAKIAGIRKAVVTSIQSGLLYFVAYSSNALAYWQGSRQIAKAVANGGAGTTVGTIYTVIFILVDATIILSTVAPFIQIFGAAQAAFVKLENRLQQTSHLSSPDGGVKQLETIDNDIRFNHVSFSYPSRLGVPVLTDLTLTIPAKMHTALVGLSGSGKSTIANLIMRLYDPTEGQITFGGYSLASLHLSAARGRMSLVQQEPVLFDRSILENIALGLVNSEKHSHLRAAVYDGRLAKLADRLRAGTEHKEAAENTDHDLADILEMVHKAADLADAHAFISELRGGFGALVGSKGTLLSGGQKQRLSLARALVKDPEILILDEATASLDSTSERKIQTALSTASKGRTTISIAHRLSTIRDADNVVVMRGGKVVEQGTHDELTAVGGAYLELLNLQNNAQESKFQSENSRSANSHEDEKYEDARIASDIRSGSHVSTKASDKNAEDAVISSDPDIDQTRSIHSILTTIAPLFRANLMVLIVAFVAIIVVGGTYSASATIFGNTVGALSPCRTPISIRSAGKFFALMFFVLAIVEFFANVISWSGFGLAAEKILHQIRVLSFRSLLEQDLHWHESANRTPSSLLGLITSDGNAIGNLTGSTVGTVFSILVNLIAAIVLTHVLAWKIAIVCLATVPLILGAGSMQLIVLGRFAAKHQEAFTRSVGIAVEAVESIRIVTALGLQDEVLHTYQRSLKSPIRETTRRSLYANMWLALAYGLPTFMYALANWWGAKLIIAGEYTQVQFFIVLIALLVSAQLWGQLFTIAPDLSKAFTSLKRVVNLITLSSSSTKEFPKSDEEEPRTSMEKLPEISDEGSTISFSNVNFNYPARPNIPVLKRLSLTIQPGQFAALVGPSGAGKSTIITLLERMYRPNSGHILIDGTNIAFSQVSFRDSISYVPQDSVLFSGSIKFNVSLGARPGQDLTDTDIEEACRIANIHSTIASLPQGYDTPCGTGGTQLSGGQKQRLAIARALIRKPRLLLLDESTSALDAESEKQFQDGLEEARRRTGMTVVAIAHRLNTIRNADVIFMIENGRVTEQGTHEELFQRCEGYRVNARHQGF